MDRAVHIRPEEATADPRPELPSAEQPTVSLLWNPSLDRPHVGTLAALGVACDAAVTMPVCFYSLEKSHEWLARRLTTYAPLEARGKLEVRTDFPGFEEGGAEELRRLAKAPGRPALVVFDHLGRLRRIARNERPSQADLRALATIRDVVNGSGTTVVVVHHVSKRGSDYLLFRGAVDACDLALAPKPHRARSVVCPEDFFCLRPRDGVVLHKSGGCTCTDDDAALCWIQRYAGFGGPRNAEEVAADGGPCRCKCHRRSRRRGSK